MVQCQSPSLVGSYSDSQPIIQSLPGSTPENLHSCSVNSKLDTLRCKTAIEIAESFCLMQPCH